MTATPLPAWPTNLNELNQYFARAVTFDNGYLSDSMDDDILMLQQLKPKFLGRAAHVWHTHANDLERFEKVERMCERIHHEVDADIMVQCAIFECITTEANKLAVPEWVFEVLGEAPEDRNFHYDDIIGSIEVRPAWKEIWGPDGGVPDLTQPEAFRWYIYRAGMYMQAGIEAIHLGQLHLVSCKDHGYVQAKRLCDTLREMAKTFARRGKVILDAHSHGIVIEGESLLDLVTRPISATSYLDADGQPRLALQWKAGYCSAMHPIGEYADPIPTLVEIDNYGGCCIPPEKQPEGLFANDHFNPDVELPLELRRSHGRWGFDDIGYYSQLPDEDRHGFMIYAHHFHRLIHPTVFYQPPITRILGNAIQVRADAICKYYRANHESPNYPEAWNDIELLTQLWNETDPLTYQADQLLNLDLDPTAPPSMHTPQPVILHGEIQEILGGQVGDSRCLYSRLDHLGDTHFARTIAIERPGTYKFQILIGGTGMEPTTDNGSPTGNLFKIHCNKAGQMICCHFNYRDRSFEAFDVVTRESVLA